MITGKKKKDFLGEIKSKITDYDIYRMFCPNKFILGKKFSSPMPLRRDSDPSFVIGCKLGNFYHFDFGDSSYRGGAIDFVMQVESVDYPTALRLIDTRFGLGIEAPLKDWLTVVKTYGPPQVKEDEQVVHIESVHRKFTEDAHKYWNAYHLTEEYLKDRNVFQVKTLYIARKKFPLDKDEIVFAYITEDGKQKIYRPTIPRKVKKEEQFYKWRFRSNVPFTYMFGKNNIKNCKKALILKSRKDELVSSLIMPCISSLQAESIVCLSPENVKYINQNAKEVFIGFGTDEQAKRESKLITSTFNWKHYNTEDKYLPLNDIAEVAKFHGLEVVEKHMKLKHLI